MFIVLALPSPTDSTVIYFISDTLIPVEQIVSMMSIRLSFPVSRAAFKSRSYSSLLSSLDESRNIFFCSFRLFTLQSCQPQKSKNELRAANLTFAVAGANFSFRRCSFHLDTSSFVTGSPFIHCANLKISFTYFSMVESLRSSLAK